jgi:hypothetical protein
MSMDVDPDFICLILMSGAYKNRPKDKKEIVLDCIFENMNEKRSE